MSEEQLLAEAGSGRHISGTTVLYASLAGVEIGGPLLGMMGFSFLTTTILLLLTSPLLIIFNPVLFGATCVIGFALLGFTAAAAMAFAGVATVAWVYRSFTIGRAEAVEYPYSGVPVKQLNDYFFTVVAVSFYLPRDG